MRVKEIRLNMESYSMGRTYLDVSVLVLSIISSSASFLFVHMPYTSGKCQEV